MLKKGRVTLKNKYIKFIIFLVVVLFILTSTSLGLACTRYFDVSEGQHQDVRVIRVNFDFEGRPLETPLRFVIRNGEIELIERQGDEWERDENDSKEKDDVDTPLEEQEQEEQEQQLSEVEQKMIDKVNSERQQRGILPLEVDYDVVEVARLKSQDMKDNNYFAHYSPTYGSPFNMLEQFGIRFRTSGENLAGSRTVETAHRNLMNSPGHRRNILSEQYTHIGVGIVEGGPYGNYYTQMFIGR